MVRLLTTHPKACSLKGLPIFICWYSPRRQKTGLTRRVAKNFRTNVTRRNVFKIVPKIFDNTSVSASNSFVYIQNSIIHNLQQKLTYWWSPSYYRGVNYAAKSTQTVRCSLGCSDKRSRGDVTEMSDVPNNTRKVPTFSRLVIQPSSNLVEKGGREYKRRSTT